MKKIILCGIAATLSFALVGCGNGANNAAITNLSNQLDDTSNTISSVQTVSPTDLNLTKSMFETATTRDSEALYENVLTTQQTLLNEEYYKMNILNKTSVLKNNLSKELKLSKAQINAVKELTNSLSKYTNSVAYTKNEMTSAVKQIASLKKNVDKNADKINAKLNKLSCNSNARSSYYENILNTLDQINSYINCEDCQNNDTQQDTQNQTAERQNPQTTQRRNIDSFLPNNQNNNCEDCEDCNNCNNQDCCPPANAQNPISNPYTYNSNNINRMNYYGGFYGNGMGYGVAPYGAGFSGTPYGRYGAPYGAGYGAGFGNGMYGYPNGAYGFGRFNRFNPSRNTDTYAPLARNVDTFKLSQNNPNTNLPAANAPLAPVTAQPEQRLEDFEEVKQDNTLQKLTKEDFENKLEKEEESTINNILPKQEDNTTQTPSLSIFARGRRIQKDLEQPIIAH